VKAWFAKYWKWLAVAALLIAVSAAWSFLPLGEWIKSFTGWVEKLGPLGVVVFVAIYTVATVLFVPGSLLTIAAGLVFGLLIGTLAASAGSIIGASCAFLIGRYFARSRIEAMARRDEKFRAIDQAIGREGWKIVALLRLSPLIPFNASNYFYGITAVKFWAYVLASWIGMLPGTVLYVYLGTIGKAGLGGDEASSPLEYVFLGVGLVATIVVTVIVTRLAKKALRKTGATNGGRKIDH
jgi:uncharacterized membrane protein YdjX (TVP38/TMEM64 family)